ncbi:hypothetical protein SAMN05444166_1151 [Singulisphaera sp. GP187]|nr:hypothetical protein SAMN05444166_1151 [Singulisphaera sp. GP187]
MTSLTSVPAGGWQNHNHAITCATIDRLQSPVLERFATGWRTEKGDRHPASKAFGEIQGLRGREPVPFFLRCAQCKGKPL